MIWSWLQHHMSLQFIGQNPLSICVGFQNPTALCSRCPLQQLRPRAHVCILCSVGFELRVALEDEYGIALTSGSSRCGVLRYWRCQCPPTGSGSSHVFKSHSSRSCFLLVSHLLAKHFGSVGAIVLRCGLTLKIAVLIHMSPVLSMTLRLTSDNRMWTAIGDDGVQLRWRVDSTGDLPGSYSRSKLTAGCFCVSRVSSHPQDSQFRRHDRLMTRTNPWWELSGLRGGGIWANYRADG